MSKKVRRLFEQFQPKHYILDLVPNRGEMTFYGSVIISGQKVGRPTQRLVFHQRGLKVTGVHITRHDKKGDQDITVDRINHHAAYNEVRLHTTQKLFPGHYTVRMEFGGKITRPMHGIYPCLFEHDGVKKQLIATQFESHYARDVFPCIDEPEAKATFQLTLTTPQEETVLSNTPIEKQEKVQSPEPRVQSKKERTQKLSALSSQLRTTFEKTPRMPTYLLAFVYGEMGYKEAKTKDGVTVRTYATPANVEFTDFALDVAVKCLEFYNDYFGIDYPLPKCDLIALPDFASGAMENWGCITFREQSLLVDPSNTSLSGKQYVAMVVAHELAHQWFGNLVTMRWWTDLWLNEGFASWIPYVVLHHLFPDWQMWTQFIVDDQQLALKLDALEHTHPVEVPVNHPDEISTIFDAISYDKGASVIHMLNDYLGAEVFRDGLRYYLKKHEYGNTDTVDLWQALEEVSHKPVKTFMHEWTSQSGYPIVIADVEDNHVHVSQQRFYINPAVRANVPHHQVWPIPLLSDLESAPLTLDKAENRFAISKQDEFKLNRGQSGFYRSIYNATHQRHLSGLVHRGKLAPLDRLGILSDVFEAAKAGYHDTVEALSLLEAYEQEDNAAVWDIIAGNLGSIRMVMDDEELRDMMKPYIRKLAAHQLKRLSWSENAGESHFDKLLRPTILGLSSLGEEPSVVKEALRLFKTMEKPEDIHPDIRGVVYGTAVRHGAQAEFDKLLGIHNSSASSEERTTITAAITGFKQPKIIRKALAQIDSPDVRLQDVGYWVAYSFMNRHGRLITWEWMVSHWKWLDKNLGGDLSFYRFPLYAARCFSDASFLPTYKEFFNSVMSPAFDRSVKQGIETIEGQSAWKKRDLKLIKAYFKAR